MRFLLTFLLVSGVAFGQAASPPSNDSASQTPSAPTGARNSSNDDRPAPPVSSPVSDPNVVTIPAGTKIPLALKQAISTKNAREGDAVYAETAFPFVMDNRVVVPAGSYIQGKIAHVERAGHGKGRAAVSYTHLDVYKRQIDSSASFGMYSPYFSKASAPTLNDSHSNLTPVASRIRTVA